MFSIQVKELYWLSDDDADLCLHGHTKVQIGREVFEYDATVSATALYLLKSITQDHLINQEIQMLPCCGHTIIANHKLDTVDIIGCLEGIDWTVLHQDKSIKIITETLQEVELTQEEYQEIVFAFADLIEDFYYQSRVRLLPKDNFERQGYMAFWNEWYRLRYQLDQKTYPIVLNDAADKKRREYLWQKISQTMDGLYPYWYPLYNIQLDIPVISFHRSLFKQDDLWEYIHQYFQIHRIEHIFEIQELTNARLIDCFTSDYFMDKDEDGYDILLMSECFWFDVSHLWLMYVSHEATITFAGYNLVSYIKKNQILLDNQFL